MEVEDVGDAIGGDAEGASGHRIGIAGAGVVDAAVGVVGAGDTDVDGAVAPREALGHLSAVLQRLPGELEQEPLLRVHLGRFPGGDAEEGGIEAIDVIENPGRPRVAPARHLGVGMVVELRAPALLVYLADEIASLREAVPQRLRARSAAGKAAGHSHDGDGFFPLAQALCLPIPTLERPAIPGFGTALRSSIALPGPSAEAPVSGENLVSGARIFP